MIPDEAKFAAGIICAVFSVLGTVLNSVSMVILLRDPKLRSHPTTILVISLSCSDLVYSSFILPLLAVHYLDCWFCFPGSTLCFIMPFAFFWNHGNLLNIQAALAVNRWAAVCTNFRITYRTSLYSIILCCVLSTMIILVPSTGLWGKLGFDIVSETCRIWFSPDELNPNSVLMPIGLGIPYTIIFVCYSIILKTIRKTNRTIELQGSCNLPFRPSLTPVSECDFSMGQPGPKFRPKTLRLPENNLAVSMVISSEMQQEYEFLHSPNNSSPDNQQEMVCLLTPNKSSPDKHEKIKVYNNMTSEKWQNQTHLETLNNISPDIKGKHGFLRIPSNISSELRKEFLPTPNKVSTELQQEMVNLQTSKIGSPDIQKKQSYLRIPSNSSYELQKENGCLLTPNKVSPDFQQEMVNLQTSKTWSPVIQKKLTSLQIPTVFSPEIPEGKSNKVSDKLYKEKTSIVIPKKMPPKVQKGIISMKCFNFNEKIRSGSNSRESTHFFHSSKSLKKILEEETNSSNGEEAVNRTLGSILQNERINLKSEKLSARQENCSLETSFTSTRCIPDIRISYVENMERKYTLRRQKRNRQELNLTFTVGIILITNLAFNLPAVVIRSIDPLVTLYPEAHIPVYVTAWFSALINPLLYVVCNSSYRAAFKRRFHIKPK
ncbi:uncharacterized protein LOC111707904 isoform X2 [Eurytemora carolleeae]|uniref:uncharacterized protein LOC111707904 isoform X2 n=1 Tax=Eurytemora carolleeae TaxID=1294199 RepID=UPI000C7946AD|nr:uncharacterized protein LOC111707904 isoform X2 [Eurytemora carolleeae]|eukprot:XP_023336857.1 uncharacterized protein LOC111707904 isoform X2 [Eurytemora affinis]